MRQAIINANNAPGSDTIEFSPSVSGTILLTSGAMTITGNLTINGSGASVLAISGNNASPIFSISSSATVTINGLTIKDGYNDSYSGGGIGNAGTLILNNCTLSGNVASFRGGGGIYNTNTLTLNNSTLSSNSGRYGGGIYNESGTMTLNNSTLSGNTTISVGDQGGGIQSNRGTITITSSILSNNSASKGGGIYVRGGTLNVTNSTLSGNSASVYNGGGIDSEGTLNVTNSTLSGNSAGSDGGGIYYRPYYIASTYSGTLTVTGSTLSGNTAGGSGGGINGGQGSASRTITNTTLSGNSAGEEGGGIFNCGGTLTLTNNTLVGNSAAGSGGGISNCSFSTLIPGNNLVIGNTAKDITTSIYNYGTVRSKGHNLFGVNNDAGLWGFIPNDSDLLLAGAVSTAIGPLADNGGSTQTHLPVVGSPAINAGDNTLIPAGVTTDQRGYGPRIVGSAVDIGAVEVGALPPDQALIESYYQAILGRPSDAAGLAAWTNESSRARSLGLDTKDVFQVMANVFFTGAEYLSRNRSDAQYITDLYRAFFNRDPDSSAVDYWTQPLTAGLPRSVVLFSFLFSAEFDSLMQGLFGTTTTRSELATVGDFYRGFLNRLPDEAGFAFWLGRFRVAQCTNAAAVRAEVESISSQFLAANEYTSRQRSDRDFIADLYYIFLRRGGDVAGFNYWVDLLSNGTFTRDQVRQEFVKATEFQSRVTQIINQGCAP